MKPGFFHVLIFLLFYSNMCQRGKADKNYDRLWEIRTLFDKPSMMHILNSASSYGNAPQMEICFQAIRNCFSMKIYRMQHDWVHLRYENKLGRGQADVHTVVSYIGDNEKFLLGQYSGSTTHFTWATCFPLHIYLIICTLVLSPVVGHLDKMLKNRCQGFWQNI
jgi:hypothetical protein